MAIFNSYVKLPEGMTYDVVLPTLFQYQRPLTCVPFSFELGHDLTRNAAPIQIQVIQVHVDFEGFSMAFPHPKPTCFSTSTERPKVWMENCRAAVLRRLGKLGNVSILENSRDLRWKKGVILTMTYRDPWLYGDSSKHRHLPKNRSENCWECWGFWIFMDGLHHFI